MSGGRFSFAGEPRSFGILGENQDVAFTPVPIVNDFEVASHARKAGPWSAFGSPAAAIVSLASCFQYS
jgi:hypothetical protein